MDEIKMDDAFVRIEEKKDDIIGVLDYIWAHPELGYKEWNTHKYLKKKYEDLGYVVHEVGNIPGFYIDIDTGKEGPTIAVFSEMDSLHIPDHPESDKLTGAVHACGHHTQCAATYGTAIGLKDKELLSSLCGKIRLFAVPCEEIVTGDFYDELLKNGTIKFLGGKKEFIYRGLLEGVDIAFMIHGGAKGFGVSKGWDGNINKRYIFKGKTSHVASPFNGLNTMNAALVAMNAANALRERSVDALHMRYYANVVDNGGGAPNNVPMRTVVDAGLRALTVKKLKEMSRDFDRAYIAGAYSQGVKLEIQTTMGYCPRRESRPLQLVFLDVAKRLFPLEEISDTENTSAGVSDIGDVSSLIPTVHAFIGDGGPSNHTVKFKILDKYRMGVTAAKEQVGVLIELLSDNAVKAKEIIKEYEPTFASREEYLSFNEEYTKTVEAVNYDANGKVIFRGE